MGERAGPRDGRRRRLFIDLTPLRRSRDLRCLVLGELISVLGSQLTTVAVPYQVYQLTRSSLDVGLVSLAQLVPLIAGPACARSSRASASTRAPGHPGAHLLDINAMVFGLPRALFPALAVRRHGVRGLRGPGLHRGRPHPRAPAARLPPSADSGGRPRWAPAAAGPATGQRTLNSGHARSQLASG